MTKRPTNLSPDVIHMIWSHWKNNDLDEDSILRRILPILNRDAVDKNLVQILDKRLHDKSKSFEEIPSHRSTPSGKMRWVDDVLVALHNLGGEADLSAIYVEVERIRREANRSIVKSLDATVRQTIEAHSIDSANYREGNEDYFRRVGRGRWKLK